jgi:hypothetical protein
MTKRFNELYDFISEKVRMSHIYQPVMLMELLRRGGKASNATRSGLVAVLIALH